MLDDLSAPPVVSWLSDSEIDSIESSSYWNDEALEGDKAWYYPETALEYLRQGSNLERAFLDLLALAESRGHAPSGVCLDIAAGVCWTSGIAARDDRVSRVVAVDLSRHRLARAPAMMEMYGTPAAKVQRVLGSFYDIRLPSASVDCMIMCQAYHHAADLDRLLKEMRRVLRPGGALLITGEEPVSLLLYRARLWQAVRSVPVYLACEVVHACRVSSRIPILGSDRWRRRPPRRLSTKVQDLFPPDPESGDHMYLVRDYEGSLIAHGFETYVQRLSYPIHHESRLCACNFLAVRGGQ